MHIICNVFFCRHHATTGPINIPGSPQRQSSSGTNTDDEDNQLNPNDQGQALLDDQVNIIKTYFFNYYLFM